MSVGNGLLQILRLSGEREERMFKAREDRLEREAVQLKELMEKLDANADKRASKQDEIFQRHNMILWVFIGLIVAMIFFAVFKH